MNPLKVFQFFVGAAACLFSATAMFWAGIAFDHRPAGWPNIPVHVAFFHFTLQLPDGPVAKLAADEVQRKAWVAALKQCHANTDSLTGAVTRQNSSVEALHAASARMLAENARAVQAATSANARAVEAETAILGTPPAGADVCSQALDIDRRFVETLK